MEDAEHDLEDIYRDIAEHDSPPRRLIYRVHPQGVVIYIIADSRRDMQSLLARRLLGTS
jgi:toxin ParE1/3/4